MKKDSTPEGREITPVAGKWALIHGGAYGGILRPDIAQIDRVTKATFSTRGRYNRSRVLHLDLLAQFDTEDEASKAAQALAGIKGERDRRVSAANLAAQQAGQKLLASFNQVRP